MRCPPSSTSLSTSASGLAPPSTYTDLGNATLNGDSIVTELDTSLVEFSALRGQRLKPIKRAPGPGHCYIYIPKNEAVRRRYTELELFASRSCHCLLTRRSYPAEGAFNASVQAINFATADDVHMMREI